MIAMRATAPQPHNRHVERGKIATRRRVRRARSRGYAAFLRLAFAALAIVVPIMVYVMLVANLTSLNDRLVHADARRTELLAQTMRQDDQIAKLESRDRLAAIAARLGMRDPQVYAVVALPAPRRAPDVAHGIAFLGAMNQWWGAATGDVHK
jgi:cell division protein FtsB